MRRVALCLLVAVALAGCTGGYGSPAAPGTSETAPDCSPPTTERLTTDTPTPTRSPTGSLSDLTVVSRYDGRVTVLLYPEGRETPTHAVSLSDGDRVDLSDETRYWTDYRVAVRIDCERADEVPAYSYEKATVTVRENGTAEKTVRAVA